MEKRYELNKNLARMLKGGVIMDVVNPEQAKIAEEAGAVAVMALERVPSDIRKQGGVARTSDPKMIKEIINAVSIPVMAKVRIGHFVEAQILEAIGVDYIDESEVLTSADAALMMQLGCDGIFKSDNPEKRAKAIVKATTYFKDPEVLAKVSENLGGAMSGLEISKLETEFAERGW
ncbi:SOR/SNZ family protein [Clostridium sporogenes]|uniref:SOR/SNZ family protein n=1 Tax=Clostridium sporogenes TaxID=1509 RepID=A0A1L3NG31_CLOSG|nr:hypothetical protein [Clostridium sporogenes]APH15076.1 SOR/SNZ family protein [Clostridium sporogenes]